MSEIKASNTSKKLILLISVFVFGFVALFSLNQVFIHLSGKLDKKTENLQAKIMISEFIAYDITKIRNYFAELATTTSTKRSRDRILEKIDDQIAVIQESLNVLQHGGVLKRFIALNIAGHLNTVKTIVYNKDNKDELSLEVIDLTPKLLELNNMAQYISKELEKQAIYAKKKDIKKWMKKSKQIHRYYKTLPAYFNRMSENISRLVYESEVELKELKKQIELDKQYYMKVKISLILSVILFVIIFGYRIVKSLNEDSKKIYELAVSLKENLKKQKKQEKSIRAILDAQSNIIIVSDGVKMIDANQQLLTFFNEYKTFADFKRHVECICDFFEDKVPNDEYIVKKDYDGLNWSGYILANPDKHFKVIIKRGAEKYHFLIQATKAVIDDETGESVIIITLNDITTEINNQIKLKSLNDNLELMVQNKTKELQELNENLEQKVLIEAAKVREKDKQMIQQARFAALGEMIGNIAHQWRQPLSAINTTASGMQLQMQLGLTNDEEVIDSYNKIIGYVEFLTQTIEDFRGFFREDKETTDFDVVEVVQKSLSIVQSAYRDNDITVEQECPEESLMSHGMPNELSQVFLNILNNAKDATIGNEIEEKYVHITCQDTDEYNVVLIQDNAGGIPEKIMDKIFDPYFTTKHQSQGTGIGLYMSKDIVEKHMNGRLSVKNMKTTINGRKFNGACFKIEIPKAK